MIWNDNLQSFNREKNEASVPVFYADWTSVSVPQRQVHADWTSGSFPFCQRSCLIWRIMTNTLTNTYVVIFLSVSIRFQFLVEVIIPESRYQNFEFTGCNFTFADLLELVETTGRKPVDDKF